MALRSYTDRVALLTMETTYGTAANPVAADAILLMNAEIQPAADKLEREVDKPYFGGDPFVLVGKRITMTADCDILGPAAAAIGEAAPLGGLYRVCGHAEVLDAGTSTSYNPISKDFESATVDFYWAGIRFRMLGVRGSVDFDFSIKNFARGSVTLTGLLTVPQDGEAPAGINWDSFQVPSAIETETWEVIVDGVNVCAQQLTLAQNADVAVIECSESREVMITDRKPTGTLRVYKDATLAIWNPFQIADEQQIIVLENTITKSAGLNVSMPIRAQLEYPRPVDIEGNAGFEIPFSAVPSGAGGDEYSLEFT